MISEASGLDISAMMDKWVKLPGFPLVSLHEDDDGIFLLQETFPSHSQSSRERESIWTIPVDIVSLDGGHTTHILDARRLKVDLQPGKGYKVNANQTGFYRVKYSANQLDEIVSAVKGKNPNLTENDRLSLVDDAMALANAGISELSILLDLVEAFKNEDQYEVRRILSTSLADISSLWWENTQVTELLCELRKCIFLPLVERLGYDFPVNEPLNDTLMRELAISEAAQANDRDVVNELKARVRRFSQGDGAALPPPLVKPAFQVTVKYGGRDEYEQMAAIANNLEVDRPPDIVSAARESLCATTDTLLLQETFRRILSEAHGSDSIIRYFVRLQGNFVARRLMAQFAMENFEEIYLNYKDGFILNVVLASAFNTLTTRKDYEDVQLFFKDKDTSKYSFAIANILDSISNRDAFVQRASRNLTKWLQKWHEQK